MAKKCMQCGGSTKKMQKGGTTSSPKLERLSGKVAKKTAAGKPVSKSLTKRYDKAVDKVITSGMTKKPLRKAQAGMSTGTPFQQYMKTPGAVASDTTMQTMYPKSNWDAPKKPVAKNPKNQGTLEKAYEKTYGQNWRSESGQPSSDETFEQYKRRMGPMKKGGSMSKMKKGGSTSFGMLSVKAGVDKNPRPTAADRIAGAKMQYGGSNKQPISRITNNTSKEMRDAYNKKTQTNTTNTISKEYKVDPNTGQVSKQKLGGMMKKKMQKGGMMKGTVGGPPKKPFAAGIPYFTGAGQTGPESMQTGGILSSALTAVKRIQRLKKTTGIANKAIKAKVDLKKGTTKAVTGPMTKTVKNIKAIAKKK
jgi:hypothetical protein